MSSEQEIGVTSETSVAEKTIEEPANDVDLVGEFTDRLSDLSEDEEEEELLHRTRKSYFATWLHRIRPLVRSKNVRAYSITNLILIFINIILLLVVIGLFAYSSVHFLMVSKMSNKHVPCLYQWSEWSECSDLCAVNSSHPPTKSRKILPDTIIRARGKYKKSAPCPQNLTSLEDTAPCNTHICPRNLSEFNWRMDSSGEKVANYYVDVKDVEKGCYKIRDIPTDDRLVQIDTTELIATVQCDNPINRLAYETL